MNNNTQFTHQIKQLLKNDCMNLILLITLLIISHVFNHKPPSYSFFFVFIFSTYNDSKQRLVMFPLTRQNIFKFIITSRILISPLLIATYFIYDYMTGSFNIINQSMTNIIVFAIFFTIFIHIVLSYSFAIGMFNINMLLGLIWGYIGVIMTQILHFSYVIGLPLFAIYSVISYSALYYFITHKNYRQM